MNIIVQLIHFVFNEPKRLAAKKKKSRGGSCGNRGDVQLLHLQQSASGIIQEEGWGKWRVTGAGKSYRKRYI